VDGQRPRPADRERGEQGNRTGVELQRALQVTLSATGGMPTQA
jgi:hypothetical protein